MKDLLQEVILLTSECQKELLICNIKKSHKNLISFFQFNFIFRFNTPDMMVRADTWKSVFDTELFHDLLSMIINQEVPSK